MKPLPVPLPTEADAVAAVAAPDSNPAAKSAPATAGRMPGQLLRSVYGSSLCFSSLLKPNLGYLCLVTDRAGVTRQPNCATY